jgi:hypothetical protein
VGFINDVDFVMPLLRGGIHGPLPQIACVVHAAIARGIDLNDVQIG